MSLDVSGWKSWIHVVPSVARYSHRRNKFSMNLIEFLFFSRNHLVLHMRLEFTWREIQQFAASGIPVSWSILSFVQRLPYKRLQELPDTLHHQESREYYAIPSCIYDRHGIHLHIMLSRWPTQRSSMWKTLFALLASWNRFLSARRIAFLSSMLSTHRIFLSLNFSSCTVRAYVSLYRDSPTYTRALRTHRAK